MQAPVAMCIVDSNSFIIKNVNHFFLQTTNRNETIIGQSFFNLLSNPTTAVFQQKINESNHDSLVIYLQNNTDIFCLSYNILQNENDNEIIFVLVKYNNKYKNIIENSPYPICILKGENLILEIANVPMLQALHINEAAIGQPFEVITPDLKDQPFLAWLKEIYTTGVSRSGIEQPVYFYPQNQPVQTTYYNFIYSPYYEFSNIITGVLVMATDVTIQVNSRKKMEAQAAMVQNLLMTAPGYICTLVGPTHIYDIVNDKYQQLFGKRVIKNKPILKALPELEGQGFDTLLDNVYYTGVPYVGLEIPITMAKDVGLQPELMYFNFSYQPMYDEENAIVSILVFGYEVTDLVIAKNKNIDNQINIASALEQKVLQRTNELIFANTELQQKNQEIAVSKYNKKFLLEFTERFAGAGLQSDYFNSLVQFIADTTQLDYAFVGRLMDDDGDGYKIETIAFSAFGKIIPNVIYPLENGPCEEIIFGSVYNYPENCSVLFPKNTTLSTYKVEGTVGLPLHDKDNKVIGLISAMHSNNIADSDNATAILKIVAKRAEIEFERISTHELLQKNNEILALKNDELEITNTLLNKNNSELFIAKEKLFSEYARNLIEATLDPLITIDTHGIITDVNEAMVKATDKTRIQLVGSDFKLYFIEKDSAAEMFSNVFKNGHVINYALSIIDGVITDVLVNASIYKNDQQHVLGAVLVARDITQIKKIEQQLTDAKLFAEEATRQAQHATHIAENAVESKQQFLSNMSHEIRTPMNAIIGFTKVMLKTDLSTKQKDYVHAIKTSGDAMIVLINDILDLAKVNAGKMTFEETPFKIATSVSAMLHLFETKIQEKNVSLVIDYDKKIPEVLLGDPIRLHQIILNLLSNAVKFTNHGTITVSTNLLLQNEESATIQFSISDTGIGITANEINNIFENFQQAALDTTKLYGGTGLGLAIVKQLVETQGGTIKVTSVIGKGSVFSFILSFKKTDIIDVEDSNLTTLDATTKNIKVLVVEDMVLNQLLMRTVLEDFGFECIIADNGKLAIEQLQQNDYDIVLMDLQMPEMNGFEATTFIRENLYSTIPIIALTADVTTVDVAKCKAVGMNDYIAKPIDEKLLYNKIMAIVKKPVQPSTIDITDENENKPPTISAINLAYLNKRTKSNSALLAEIITVYLEQTPTLLSVMKSSLFNKDWDMLQATIHKMIPSFSIMGFDNSFELMAKQIQAYALTQLNLPNVHELIFKIDEVCLQACYELGQELNNLKR